MVSFAREQSLYAWDEHQLDLLITPETHVHTVWMYTPYNMIGRNQSHTVGVLCNCADLIEPPYDVMMSKDQCVKSCIKRPELVKPFYHLPPKFYPLITPQTHEHTTWVPWTGLFSNPTLPFTHPAWPFRDRPEDVLPKSKSYTVSCNQTGENCREVRPYDGRRDTVNELFHIKDRNNRVIWKPHPRLFWAARTISRAWKRWWYTVLRPGVITGLINSRLRCKVCCRPFRSRTKLFKHLNKNKSHLL